MEESRVAQKVVARANGTSLFVERSDHETRDSRVEEGARAHGTRLERGVDRHVVETPLATLSRYFAQRHYLGVSSRVVIELSTIFASPDNQTIGDDHATNWDIVVPSSARRLGQGLSHEAFVVIHAREA
jgi:hypothetical protein